MTIVGFNFTKISCEKKKQATGKVNIANKLNIAEVKEAKLTLGKTQQKGVDFVFKYSSSYEPDIGAIELVGHVIYMEKEDKVKEILDSWSKTKTVHKEVMGKIYNSILSKCNIESLLLSREINLPPNLPMPKVKTDGK
jgi:hypothetical protein